jgi:hypothetical protein
MICVFFWKNCGTGKMAETTFYNLVNELEKYLEYQRDEGIQRLEVDRAVLAELKYEPPRQLLRSPKWFLFQKTFKAWKKLHRMLPSAGAVR